MLRQVSHARHIELDHGPSAAVAASYLPSLVSHHQHEFKIIPYHRLCPSALSSRAQAGVFLLAESTHKPAPNTHTEAQRWCRRQSFSVLGIKQGGRRSRFAEFGGGEPSWFGRGLLREDLELHSQKLRTPRTPRSQPGGRKA